MRLRMRKVVSIRGRGLRLSERWMKREPILAIARYRIIWLPAAQCVQICVKIVDLFLKILDVIGHPPKLSIDEVSMNLESKEITYSESLKFVHPWQLGA